MALLPEPWAPFFRAVAARAQAAVAVYAVLYPMGVIRHGSSAWLPYVAGLCAQLVVAQLWRAPRTRRARLCMLATALVWAAVFCAVAPTIRMQSRNSRAILDVLDVSLGSCVIASALVAFGAAETLDRTISYHMRQCNAHGVAM
jgi:hypothetical protein